MSAFELRPIGSVRSELSDRDDAPKQGDEGGPEAWLEFDDDVYEALRDLKAGDEILLLTWLHLARRHVMRVHPRSDPARILTGVFSTRSPDRPNPIGLHRVRVIAVDGLRVQVDHLEVLDGTPVIDVKAVLDEITDR